MADFFLLPPPESIQPPPFPCCFLSSSLISFPIFLSLSLFPSLRLSLSLARFLFLSLSVGVCPFRVSAAVEIRSECRTQGDGVHRS